jgi:hypothetical protein
VKNTIMALAVMLLAGCAAQSVKQDMSAFQAAAPRSILVVPAVNKSLDVDAPNYVLSTLPVPLAEKGYYVFPVNTTKYVLEQEGMYEADRIHNQPTESLAKLFGADAVLYVTINRWDAQYSFIATTVTVDFDYRMVSKDGTEIWKEHIVMHYSPGNNNSGLIGAIVSAAITRAAPNYIHLTQQANKQVFVLGQNALPDGPYKLKKSP